MPLLRSAQNCPRPTSYCCLPTVPTVAVTDGCRLSLSLLSPFLSLSALARSLSGSDMAPHPAALQARHPRPDALPRVCCPPPPPSNPHILLLQPSQRHRQMHARTH
eukprot:3322951-Rhodomonas_salina.3